MRGSLRDTAPVNDRNLAVLTMSWQQATAQWLMARTLIEDARVQDPSFQCYEWDFTPPEDDPEPERRFR